LSTAIPRDTNQGEQDKAAKVTHWLSLLSFTVVLLRTVLAGTVAVTRMSNRKPNNALQL
jgi:hypothetical protein